MGQTMTSKILARASARESVRTGEIVLAQIQMLSVPDAALFIDKFDKHGLKVWDPERILFCFDHLFQPEWFPVNAAKEHPKIRKFAKTQGIPAKNIYDIGRNGISHQIPVEEGWALPGTVCIGVDTQSATMGAANCLALPCLWGADAILLTGDIWMKVPECIRVHLTGELPRGLLGKDIAYRLLKDLGSVVNGRVLEFTGPGVEALSIDVRMAVANGAVQMGALTMVFPADQKLLDYMKPRARDTFEGVEPDADADYVARYDYHLPDFDYLIAGPHEIEIVRPLGELLGMEVTAANIGSCSGGRFEDLALAAEVLRGRKIHPDVRLVVTPISSTTMRDAMAAGILQVLVDAGATLTNPGCGACYSGNLSPLKLGDGERCISTSVETVKGRMGSLEAEILLGNAAVVAASAIEGRIASPAKYLNGWIDGA